MATTTSPAPARSAERDARLAAPVSPGEPATTSTAPAAYLSPAAAFGGIAATAPSPTSHAAAGTATADGMPMSATTTRPAWPAPGCTRRPTRSPW